MEQTEPALSKPHHSMLPSRYGLQTFHRFGSIGRIRTEDVQPLVDSWEKFEDVAEMMKAKGYYMTGSYADTYRVFSNNADKPWVDENKVVQILPGSNLMEQAERFVELGYTKTEGIWDSGKTIEFAEGGKYSAHSVLPGIITSAWVLPWAKAKIM